MFHIFSNQQTLYSHLLHWRNNFISTIVKHQQNTNIYVNGKWNCRLTGPNITSSQLILQFSYQTIQMMIDVDRVWYIYNGFPYLYISLAYLWHKQPLQSTWVAAFIHLIHMWQLILIYTCPFVTLSYSIYTFMCNSCVDSAHVQLVLYSPCIHITITTSPRAILLRQSNLINFWLASHTFHHTFWKDK